MVGLRLNEENCVIAEGPEHFHMSDSEVSLASVKLFFPVLGSFHG